ncbi:MFS transporter [Amycolatopsis ultiminotia]|uniref:MFS transporter n=1 Tax=Amycolatopsis ultiminotia TaxID=543629 RepID=A0ABP6YSY9_9PSEU
MSEGRKPGFGEPLRNREFRALWLAELVSIVGDQLPRVALAMLVFAQTSSALLTALTYGLTLMPSLLGGMLLSGLADRFPRRDVMIVADVVRAVLAGTMAVPGMPLTALWVCVGLLGVAAGPFKAAQASLLPEVLGTAEQYEAGLSLRQFTTQTAQFVGVAAGGAVLVVIEPHLAMVLNAGTFVLSAVLVMGVVRRRPAARSADAADEPVLDGRIDVSAGRGLIGALYGLVALLGLYMVPEGLAAPYGHQLGVGAAGIGLLLAVDPVGSAVAAWLSPRLTLPSRVSTVCALAAFGGALLALCSLGPPLWLTLVLWAAVGAVTQLYVIKTQTVTAAIVPNGALGGVMGRMGTTMYCSQGLMIVAGGAVADRVGPFFAVGLAGAVAAVLAGVIGGWWLACSRRNAGSKPAGLEGGDHHSLPRMPDTSPRDRDHQASWPTEAGATPHAADQATMHRGPVCKVGNHDRK